ncbi:hypothetical protein ANN_11949 [Periplaneta americana]|uniref:Uncharacterized protein n=1 Tax=Periplaneta americana TaxID=6978 RepID=A0ABQ8T7Y8_PERAM|nr:hypothetical protein ANN_11949 [Periplaneta americana]
MRAPSPARSHGLRTGTSFRGHTPRSDKTDALPWKRPRHSQVTRHSHAANRVLPNKRTQQVQIKLQTVPSATCWMDGIAITTQTKYLSSIVRNAPITSLIPFHFLKPNCSSSNSSSRRIAEYDIRLIVLNSLHFLALFFFGIGSNTVSVKSSGKILRKRLRLQSLQAIKPEDKVLRRNFGICMQTLIENAEEFIRSVVFSDVGHFPSFWQGEQT